MTDTALAILEQTTSRLREEYPSVQPYSETQARFWLTHVGAASAGFGILVAQGALDMWAWEAYYSKERWVSSDATLRAPDLDGTRRSEVTWCGLPDGGLGHYAWCRRWEPELGSEEEVEFLAAVAVKETEGMDARSQPDYALQSHMLLGVLCAALETEQERHMEELRQRIVQAGRLTETRSGPWVRHVLLVMEPYVREFHGRPAAGEDLLELFRHILVENGQLLARWKRSSTSKEFHFDLEARPYVG